MVLPSFGVTQPVLSLLLAHFLGTFSASLYQSNQTQALAAPSAEQEIRNRRRLGQRLTHVELPDVLLVMCSNAFRVAVRLNGTRLRSHEPCETPIGGIESGCDERVQDNREMDSCFRERWEKDRVSDVWGCAAPGSLAAVRLLSVCVTLSPSRRKYLCSLADVKPWRMPLYAPTIRKVGQTRMLRAENKSIWAILRRSEEAHGWDRNQPRGSRLGQIREVQILQIVFA